MGTVLGSQQKDPGAAVGPGVVLLIIGAIFAFAVRNETPGVDIQTVGWILMFGGIAMFLLARRGERHEHEVTRIEESDDPDHPKHIYRESTTDRDVQ
jgi:uncharacterized membrane protein HdeD (DUF308 family)